MIFKTPQEAIAACDKAGEDAWTEFSQLNNIKEETDPVAYNITKQVFRVGYMAGAMFISSYIVTNMQKHAQTKVITPNNEFQ